jgi:hypothetical protein
VELMTEGRLWIGFKTIIEAGGRFGNAER